MDLHAYTKTIFDLFSINKKYVVPRFQREYSWGEEEISELWKDLISNISLKDGKLCNQEYFIGSLVLVGEDKSTEFKIVDGQQRLTTIAILLSALVEAFKQVDQPELAKGLYSFIEGRDVSNRQFFKLENENPKPFLQNAIQNFEKVDTTPVTDEETNLYNGFWFFSKKLTKASLAKEFQSFWETTSCDELRKYCSALEAIRDQALTFLKTIYITVGNEDEAYTIFETLNARGMDLSPIDLMKNEIFKVLSDEHPVDNAKFKWKALQANLNAREERINTDVFVRHFWLSKFEFTTEDKIYKSFKRITKGDVSTIRPFLDDLVKESDNYKRVIAPQLSDWKQQEERAVYNSLAALNIFKVTQVRTLLIALLAQREQKLVDLTSFRVCTTMLENFHFLFSALTSSRASGLESKYSKYARNLRACKKAIETEAVIKGLRDDLKQKVPSVEATREAFKKLSFTDDETRHKKLIQYIFKRWEMWLQGTNELEPSQITLEHIAPQSNEALVQCVGSIGNLLPLGGTINGLAGAEDFKSKLELYKGSRLCVVREFLSHYGECQEWGEAQINARTIEIADLGYNSIWKI